MASAKEIHKQNQGVTKTETQVPSDERRWSDHDLDKLATAVAFLAGRMAEISRTVGEGTEEVAMLKKLAYDVSRYGIPF